MFWFALASLTPAVLLGLAAIFGGVWPGIAVFSITVLVFFADKLASRLLPEGMDQDGRSLSLVQAGAHFVLWGLGVWAIGAGDHLNTLDKILLVIGLGLYFGQVSNSNAHELIHNTRRLPRRIGIAVYASLLFGHHASAHARVHHIWAGTPRDPNTARLGEGFWRYLVRAWAQGFTEGKKAEDKMRARLAAAPSRWTHPYVGYVAGSALALAASVALAGTSGILVLLIIASYAQVQLYLSDYVQHYGLMRRLLPDGTYEPMGKTHSWNAPHWYSSAMMLNAPRHSDHHMNPSRAFPSLRLDAGEMPMLPQSLPVMAVIALVPPLWKGLMDHRAARWNAVPTRDAADLARFGAEKLATSGASAPHLPEWGHGTPRPHIPASAAERDAGTVGDDVGR